MAPEVRNYLWIVRNCDFLTVWRKTVQPVLVSQLVAWDKQAAGRQLHLERKRCALVPHDAHVQSAFDPLGT